MPSLDVLVLVAFLAATLGTAICFAVSSASAAISANAYNQMDSFMGGTTATQYQLRQVRALDETLDSLKLVSTLTLIVTITCVLTLGAGVFAMLLLQKFRIAVSGPATPSEKCFPIPEVVPEGESGTTRGDSSVGNTVDFAAGSLNSSRALTNPLALRPFNRRDLDSSDGEGLANILPPPAARLAPRPNDRLVVDTSFSAVDTPEKPDTLSLQSAQTTGNVLQSDNWEIENVSPLVRAGTVFMVEPPPVAGGISSPTAINRAPTLRPLPTPSEGPQTPRPDLANVATNVDKFHSLIVTAKLHAASHGVEVSREERRRFHARINGITTRVQERVHRHRHYCTLLKRDVDSATFAVRRQDESAFSSPTDGPALSLPHLILNAIMCETMTLVDDPHDDSNVTTRSVAMHVGFLSVTRIDGVANFHGPSVEAADLISRMHTDHSRCLATEAFITDCNPRYFLTNFRALSFEERRRCNFLGRNEIALVAPAEFLSESLGLGLRLYLVTVEGIDDFDSDCPAIERWLERYDAFAEFARTGDAPRATESYAALQTHAPTGLMSAAKHLITTLSRYGAGGWVFAYREPGWTIESYSSPTLEALPTQRAASPQGSLQLSAKPGVAKGREMLRRCTTVSSAAVVGAGGFLNAMDLNGSLRGTKSPASLAGADDPQQFLLLESFRKQTLNKALSRNHLSTHSPSESFRLNRRDTANHGALFVRELEAARKDAQAKTPNTTTFTAFERITSPNEFDLSDDGSTVADPMPPKEFCDQWKAKWSRSDQILGQGATANVHLGMNALTGDLVAIKCVPIAFFDDQDKVKAFGAEVATLVKLRHPNIVRYKSFAVSDEWALVVMEYISGGTLHSVSQNFGALPEAVVVRYMFDVFTGLEFLHSKGIMHRDIKPQNVLLSLDGSCKLSDFGTAHHADDGELEGGVVKGSPLYMSPEQARGDPQLATDVWGAALIAVAMLRGEAPYEAAVLRDASPMSLVLKIGSCDPSMRPVLVGTTPMQDLLQKCFEPDPTNRITAAQALMHSIFTEARAARTKKEKPTKPRLTPLLSDDPGAPIVSVDGSPRTALTAGDSPFSARRIPEGTGSQFE